MGKTRVVLMLDDTEFARLAGGASGAQLSLQDFIKREMLLTDDARKRQAYLERCAQYVAHGALPLTRYLRTRATE
jgi:hypothetical protein